MTLRKSFKCQQNNFYFCGLLCWYLTSVCELNNIMHGNMLRIVPVMQWVIFMDKHYCHVEYLIQINGVADSSFSGRKAP